MQEIANNVEFIIELTKLISKHNLAKPNQMTSEFMAKVMCSNTDKVIKTAHEIELHHKAMEYGDA